VGDIIMKHKISSDDVEKVIEYLIEKYKAGISFHKSVYIERDLGVPSKRIAKILERIRDEKKVLVEKYGKRVWLVKEVPK
jgi:hypothetical protein